MESAFVQAVHELHLLTVAIAAALEVVDNVDAVNGKSPPTTGHGKCSEQPNADACIKHGKNLGAVSPW
jgi:hypothetical protein